MQRTCVIIEDQPPAQRILQEYIKAVDSLDLKRVFSNAIDALEYLQSEKIDLIFLDIHLPQISGIDFLKMIPNSPQVILTTAFSEYALESYEYNVIDYLLKPFSFQRFLQAVNKRAITKPESSLNQQRRSPKQEIFYIKSGYDLVKVESEDIFYIKSDGDYTEIFIRSKKVLSSDALKTWLEKLDQTFCQIHKSFVINVNKIEKVSGNQVLLENDIALPIGRTFKTNFMKQYID